MVRGSLTGSRIRDRRIASGIRQSELARAVGISASYLNLIEHNRRRIGGKLLNDLARALRCEPAVLTEGGEAMLLAALRDAAAGAPGADAGVGPESVEEFAGRFPGWAALLAERHGRVERLEREVRALSDRLAHDPHLSSTIHELLTAVTSIRSTASILAGEDLNPTWAARFRANLDADGRRLAQGAEALVRYLDAPALAETAVLTPQEEVEAFFAARGWWLEPLEGPDATEETAEALVSAAAELTTAPGRALALRAARRYLADARRMPRSELAARLDSPPGALAAAFGVSPDVVLRRLGLWPDRDTGLVIADAAGAITFRKPVPGFLLPRHGAGCPLWTVFEAFSRPQMPLSGVLTMQVPGARRFRADAIAVPTGSPVFGQSPVCEATMLLSPLRGEGEAAEVGPACRICPREPCPERREPSVLGPGTAAAVPVGL